MNDRTDYNNLLKFEPLNEGNIQYRATIVNDGKNCELIGLDNKISPSDNIEWFKKYETEKTKYFFIVYNNGEPCGMVGLMNIDPTFKTGEVFIVLNDAAKGKGIGKKSMDFIMDYAKTNHSVRKIYLSVLNENTIAINLYKKIGFSEIKNSSLVGELEMEKSI
ncbi:MAG: GNAT family N-acetyltransferase [Candidatus Saccharibacteria bacterium]